MKSKNKKQDSTNNKAKNFGGTVKRLLGFFAPYKKQLIAVLVFAFLGTLFLIIGPKVLGEATNTIFAGVASAAEGNEAGAGIDFVRLSQILASLVVIYGLSALFTYMQQRVTARVAQRTVFDLREAVDQKIQRLPLNYFDTHTHGDILSRTTTDIERISATIQQSMTQLITAVFTIIGIIVMMFSISWQMTLIALLVLPAALFLSSLVVRKSQKYYIGQQNKLGNVNSYVEEMYSGHNIIKLYNTEKRTEAEFDEMNDALYEDARRSQFASSILMPITNLVGNVGYVGICVLGGIMTSNGTLTVGAIQAFIQYMQQFTQPIVQTSNIVNLLQSTVAAAERVFELLDEPEQVPENKELKVIGNIKGEITFDHVRFGYTPDRILISDMNVHVAPGHKVAIVGPTGAGKTTLVNLLMRFYELNSGSIQVDSVDIRDISRQNLRQQFGMVLQETWLYSGSIRDNIRYGRPEATDEEVYEACRMANVDSFIRTLPGGYDMIINEDGSNISQGQKQLLTIARAFCARPQVLILDEATSSVDTRTEKLIQDAMDKLTQGRTSFMIAHRLSTIKDADIILVMKDGDIIEQGSHDELMAQNGFYTGLYNSQFA
ncbi:MAG: ABC transporter ATP-binding protein [Christensenella sp.]|uniref:ABC transporter ATP-binding protein n=1 Tax=Christensenella sp. TaxID=1935934 RepID=UPI002B21F63B|nr:ABC transporter ATP-binding protein [Christensenella sp.]MEA5003928.1 ABC transporter ATP-binding protein [Christensenella sp.]